MAGVPDHGTFFGKGLQRVAGDKPGCLDVVLLEQLKQPSHTHSASEETSLQVSIPY